MFDCRTAVARRTAPLPPTSPLPDCPRPSSPGGIASPLLTRDQIDYAADRKAACATVASARPSRGSSCRLHHAQDRLQHPLEVGDLLLQTLPAGRSQFIKPGAVILLGLPPLRFHPAIYGQAL